MKNLITALALGTIYSISPLQASENMRIPTISCVSGQESLASGLKNAAIKFQRENKSSATGYITHPQFDFVKAVKDPQGDFEVCVSLKGPRG